MVIVFVFLLVPVIRFYVPYSVVIEASDGSLLGAKIADDGQWRFPVKDSVPEKFLKCILNFEDRKFYYHPGIDPVAIVRQWVKISGPIKSSVGPVPSPCRW